MEPRDPACERVGKAFERLIDGDPDVVELKMLKGHLASCETCKALYVLDLALIESIRTSPNVVFKSVASEVVGKVRARERRALVLHWGPVVGVASWVGMLVVVYGRGFLERLVGLLTGGLGSSPVLGGLSRVAGVGLKLLNIAKSLAFDSALGSGAWACAPQVAMGTLMAGVLVIFMMYGMGIWLGKLREARSWQGI